MKGHQDHRIKYILLASMLVGLTGCNSVYQGTAPGAPIPKGIAACLEWDAVGRCKHWSSESETCINPKGMDAQPPLVPCNSFKR